jgi:hypothetical protein
MNTGVLAAYPLEHMKITVKDGSFHQVDSDAMSFELCAKQGFREAGRKAKPVLLEPIMKVEVLTPDQYMGDVTGDLNRRRGMLEGMDSKHGVQVIKANKFIRVKQEVGGDLNLLVGDVLMKQNNTLFYCDSAIQNIFINQIEAFGNIHINDNDSVHTYSQYMKYDGNARVAQLKNKVKLTDGKGVLTTEALEYKVDSKIGTYLDGGKVVNEKSVLTSKIGIYYADRREVYFQKNECFFFVC